VRTSVPPVRDTAADAAMAYIKKEIWLGHLRPGDRLIPAEIAQAVGVSPTPVREAVAALTQQGRLISRNHHGVIVGPFNVDNLREHYELLALVYSWEVRRSADRLTDPERAELGSLGDQLADCHGAAELWDTVRAIEALIYQTAGSFIGERVARSLMGVVPDDIYSWVPPSGPLAQERMAAMIQAMCAGDIDTASTQANDFLIDHGSLVIDHLRQNGII